MKTINGRSVIWLGLLLLLLTVIAGACDKKNPAEPTPVPPTPAPTYTLIGAVTDGTSPIPNASIRIVGGATTNFGKTATTNAAGRYSIDGIVAERIIVEASAAGYDVGSQSPTISGNTTLDFALRRSVFTVTGTVTDTTSNGVLPGVEVRITGGTSPNFGKNTVTNASGQYTLTGVAAERIIMEASASGYEVANASPTITTDTTVNFRMNRLGPSTGMIIFRIDQTSCGTSPSSPIVDVFIDGNNVGTIYNVTTPGSQVSRTVSTGAHTVQATGSRGADYPLTNVSVLAGGNVVITVQCTS